jgi:phosphatidylglycerophosphate synthase
MILLAIMMFGRGTFSNVFALILVAVAFFMDAIDGWVARKLKTASDLGGVLDIAADRVVEMSCWLYFASVGIVPYWMPLAIFIRGITTDTIRSVGLKLGKSFHGKKSMIKSKWGKAIITSNWSRGGYGVLKAITFIFLGFIILVQDLPASMQMHVGYTELLKTTGVFLAYMVVIFCAVRAVPVLIDGRRYFTQAHAV